MNIYIVIMCIVKKRSLNTLFISSLLNLFLLLSEKSNSIDEIIFSYSVLIDTLKSTNIQINRKEFGLTCIVKKSLYSYWYFFHSVYKDGPTHWFDPASPVVCEETQAIDFRTPRNEPDSNRNLQHVKSISFPSLTPLREIYKISCLFPLHPTTREIYSIARGSRLVYFTFVRVDITLWDYRNNALHVTVSWRLL